MKLRILSNNTKELKFDRANFVKSTKMKNHLCLKSIVTSFGSQVFSLFVATLKETRSLILTQQHFKNRTTYLSYSWRIKLTYFKKPI